MTLFNVKKTHLFAIFVLNLPGLVSVAYAENVVKPVISHQNTLLPALWQDALQSYPSIRVLEATKHASIHEFTAMDAKVGPTLILKSELSNTTLINADAQGVGIDKNFFRTANQLTLSYPLYQPKLADSATQSTYVQQANQWAIEAEKQAIRKNVALLVLQYQQLSAKRQFYTQELQAIRDTYNQIEQRFQLGYQDLNDIANIQAQRDNSLAEQLLIEQNQLKIIAELNAFLSQPVLEEQLKHTIIVKPTPLILPTNWQAQHPTLLKQHWQWKAFLKQQDVIDHTNAPTLNAFGSLIYNDSGQKFYDDMQGLKAGVTLNIPFYLGGERQANKAMIKAKAKQKMAEKNLTERTLLSQATLAQHSISLAKRILMAQQSAINSSQQALEAIQEGVKTGTRSQLELLKAQRRLYRANQAVPVTQAQIAIDIIKFHAAVGTLGQSFTFK